MSGIPDPNELPPWAQYLRNPSKEALAGVDKDLLLRMALGMIPTFEAINTLLSDKFMEAYGIIPRNFLNAARDLRDILNQILGEGGKGEPVVPTAPKLATAPAAVPAPVMPPVTVPTVTTTRATPPPSKPRARPNGDSDHSGGRGVERRPELKTAGSDRRPATRSLFSRQPAKNETPEEIVDLPVMKRRNREDSGTEYKCKMRDGGTDCCDHVAKKGSKACTQHCVPCPVCQLNLMPVWDEGKPLLDREKQYVLFKGQRLVRACMKCSNSMIAGRKPIKPTAEQIAEDQRQDEEFWEKNGNPDDRGDGDEGDGDEDEARWCNMRGQPNSDGFNEGGWCVEYAEEGVNCCPEHRCTETGTPGKKSFGQDGQCINTVIENSDKCEDHTVD